MTQTAEPLIGRDGELQALDRLLEDVRGRQDLPDALRHAAALA